MSYPMELKLQQQTFDSSERDSGRVPLYLAESGIHGGRQHIDLNSPTTRHDMMSTGNEDIEDDTDNF